MNRIRYRYKFSISLNVDDCNEVISHYFFSEPFAILTGKTKTDMAYQKARAEVFIERFFGFSFGASNFPELNSTTNTFFVDAKIMSVGLDLLFQVFLCKSAFF